MIDYITNLSETKKKIKYALVVVDRLLKYSLWILVKNLKRETLIRVLIIYYIRYYTLSTVIISDQEAQFI